MSRVEFKDACKAHRKLCPYKATAMGRCGANVKMEEDGKCPKVGCHYMDEFKKILRETAI